MVSSNQNFIARYFGPFRIATNSKLDKIIICKEKPLIKDMIEEIIQKYQELKESFYIKGEFNNNIIIVINGEDIRSLKGLETYITPSDRISFYIGVGGG